MKAHSLSYTVPLPWRHRFTVLGVQATSRPDLPTGFNQKGNTWQVSTRYEVPLPHTADLTHQIQIGTDFKRSNNNLDFGGTKVYSNATEVAQAVAEYSGTLRDAWGGTALTTMFVVSPGNLAPNNTTEAFRLGGGRALSKSNYSYMRGSLERLTRIEDMTWASKLVGQASSAALLSSEQLGVGGATTVRGFQEYESLGDNGVIFVNELRSPIYSPSKGLNGPDDSLQFLAFVDAGRTMNKYQESGVQKIATLVGAGVGFRYSIESYLTAKVDYAHQLTGLSDIGEGGSRIHASFIVSY
jgi:hemolysin activation/secretion protein